MTRWVIHWPSWDRRTACWRADGLARPTIDPELNTFLDQWLSIRRHTAVVITVRRGESLAHRWLAFHHLGPLSRLSQEDDLAPPRSICAGLRRQARAYENLGGHPRALEYLDAPAARRPDCRARGGYWSP